ncbi:hypothetical protein [Vibrio tritonius]|uniref:hypothetical protein n=1 Tax=Vibrio tritonius TaxID=1435069 RepID=UPI000838677D|nr:hypothetical protein [Vibrio tritonius]
MKRASKTYRLQMIKEVATRNQTPHTDPMADYIFNIMANPEARVQHAEPKVQFAGVHFDEKVGGWVSDRWNPAE